MLPNIEPSAARKFVVAIKRLADDLTYGLDGSRFLGSGIDYVQSRQYIAGDPVKSDRLASDGAHVEVLH